MAAARQGDVRAQLALGKAYRKGDMLSPNYEQAIAFLRLAIDQQDREAEFTLGQMRLNGEGSAADPEQAIRHFRKAADNDHMLAQYTLAELLHMGTGRETGYDRSRLLLRTGRKARIYDGAIQNRAAV